MTKAQQSARCRRWRLTNAAHVKAYDKQWRATHPEHRLRNGKKTWLKHREKYVAQKRRKYHEVRSDPARRTIEKERRARLRLLHRYGLTGEQYDRLLVKQGGGCAVCAIDCGTKTNPTLHVDHNHTTGKVRGLLCQNCNTAIGSFREDPALLLRALAYLQHHSAAEVA